MSALHLRASPVQRGTAAHPGGARYDHDAAVHATLSSARRGCLVLGRPDVPVSRSSRAIRWSSIQLRAKPRWRSCRVHSRALRAPSRSNSQRWTASASRSPGVISQRCILRRATRCRREGPAALAPRRPLPHHRRPTAGPGRDTIQMLRAITSGVLALIALTAPVAAQYPNKPITIIVPFAAGGPTTSSPALWARTCAASLARRSVENIGGAGGRWA